MLTKFPVEHLKNLYVTTSKDSEQQSHYAKYPMYKCFFVCQSLKSFNLGIILPFKDSLQMVFTPVFIIILLCTENLENQLQYNFKHQHIYSGHMYFLSGLSSHIKNKIGLFFYVSQMFEHLNL